MRSCARQPVGFWIQRPSALTSCALFIDERPFTLRRRASEYSCSYVGPRAPRCDRWPPRRDEDMSRIDVRLAVFDSPALARSLLTVRAAISSARLVLWPRCFALALMCSYCRSRFGLDPRGMTATSQSPGLHACPCVTADPATQAACLHARHHDDEQPADRPGHRDSRQDYNLVWYTGLHRGNPQARRPGSPRRAGRRSRAGGSIPRSTDAGDHGRGKCRRQAVELPHARPTVTDPLGESVHDARWPLPVVLATAPRGPGQRANRPHHPRQPRRPEYRLESATPARRLPRREARCSRGLTQGLATAPAPLGRFRYSLVSVVVLSMAAAGARRERAAARPGWPAQCRALPRHRAAPRSVHACPGNARSQARIPAKAPIRRIGTPTGTGRVDPDAFGDAPQGQIRADPDRRGQPAAAGWDMNTTTAT